MPHFKRADESVMEMASELLLEFETYEPILEAKVRIDYVFAYPDYDDNGNPTNDALRKNGCKALGIAKKLSPKDRALREFDAEITLDGEWWSHASHEEQRALLDHELHHIAVRTDIDGCVKRDDSGRPKIYLRPHDYEFGWFRQIAARHGIASQERQQAKAMMEDSGQYFWPFAVVEKAA